MCAAQWLLDGSRDGLEIRVCGHVRTEGPSRHKAAVSVNSSKDTSPRWSVISAQRIGSTMHKRLKYNQQNPGKQVYSRILRGFTDQQSGDLVLEVCDGCSVVPLHDSTLQEAVCNTTYYGCLVPGEACKGWTMKVHKHHKSHRMRDEG